MDQSLEVVVVDDGVDGAEGSALALEAFVLAVFGPETVDGALSEDFFWYASAYQPPPFKWKAEALMSLVTLERH